MAYKVTELAKLSGVSVRTLHWYDKIGLLKPSYYGDNGFRYYGETELLNLQQILFFKELGFELKQIKKLLTRGDFNQIVALTAHRKVLVNDLQRIKQLIQTIDSTIEHLKGAKKMQEHELYQGFSKEKQAEYEKFLTSRFGDKMRDQIAESKKNLEKWSKSDLENSKREFDEICKSLTTLLEKGFKPDSQAVQMVISRHFNWLKQFWLPNKLSYAGHGKLIVVSELSQTYEGYHPELPKFISKAIGRYAETQL